MDTDEDNVFSELTTDIDGTPMAVGVIVLAALGILYGLERLGFRFVFGVSGGVGK